MNTFVTKIALDDLSVDDLVGPFIDEAAAIAWMKSDIETLAPQYPDYITELSDDGLIGMFSNESEEDPDGFMYQVILATAPVEVVTDEP